METYVIYTMLVFLLTSLMTLGSMFDPNQSTYKSAPHWIAVVMGMAFALWAAVVL